MANNQQLGPTINESFFFPTISITCLIFCIIMYLNTQSTLFIYGFRSKRQRMRKNSWTSRIQYHSPLECSSCVALQSIPTGDMTRLQHHYKFCAIYSLYYRVMTALQLKVTPTNKTSEKKLRVDYIYDPKEAEKLCQSLLSTTKDKWENSFSVPSSGLRLLGEMSKQLIGPTDPKQFDCDRYEEYLQCLQQIAIAIDADKVLLDDLDTYLDPYLGDDKTPWWHLVSRNADQEWKKTFVLLRHSEKDDDFGVNLKKIATKNSFLFPKEYTYKCHKSFSYFTNRIKLPITKRYN